MKTDNFDLDKRLFDFAKQSFDHAYAPYSKFHVGAAILAKNGKIYTGANVENASYPQGVCAETSAISAMASDGAREIVQILIMGKTQGLVTPCGGCRQRIAEFSNEKTRIFIASPSQIQAEFSLEDLLPHQFGEDALNNT